MMMNTLLDVVFADED